VLALLAGNSVQLLPVLCRAICNFHLSHPLIKSPALD